MNAIPRITITRHGSGWLVQCRKPGSAVHWEQVTPGGRDRADRRAKEHEKDCQEGKK